MIKVIEEGKSPIVEYHCDGCDKEIGGQYSSPEKALPNPCLQVSACFDASSQAPGLIFDRIYCGECAFLIKTDIELLFEKEIK